MKEMYQNGDKTSGDFKGIVGIPSVKVAEKTRLFKLQDGNSKNEIYTITVDGEPLFEVTSDNRQEILTPHVNSKLTLLKLNLFSKFTIRKDKLTKKNLLEYSGKINPLEKGIRQ